MTRWAGVLLAAAGVLATAGCGLAGAPARAQSAPSGSSTTPPGGTAAALSPGPSSTGTPTGAGGTTTSGPTSTPAPGTSGATPPAGSEAAPSAGASAEPASLRRLDPALHAALDRAIAAARSAGVRLRVTSAWRSAHQQQLMFDAEVRRTGSVAAARLRVLPPAQSHHVTGRAVDLGPRAAATWLQRNGFRFGLCNAYANEWWHFELLTSPGARCPKPLPHP